MCNAMQCNAMQYSGVEWSAVEHIVEIEERRIVESKSIAKER
jgi:hypothetical protein